MSTAFIETPMAAPVPALAVTEPKPEAVAPAATSMIDAALEREVLAAGMLPSSDDDAGRAGSVLLSALRDEDLGVPLHRALLKAYRAAVAAAEAESVGCPSAEGRAVGAIGLWEIQREAKNKDGEGYFPDVMALTKFLRDGLKADGEYAPHTESGLRAIKSQCRRLRRVAVLRKLAQVGSRLHAAANETAPEEAATLVSQAADIIGDLKAAIYDAPYRSMAAVVKDLDQLHRDLLAGKSQALPTGYEPLDEMLLFGGLGPGQMVVVAAAPGAGKSAFAGGFALNIARRGTPLGIFTREMSDVDLALRIEAGYGEIPIWQICDRMTPAVFAKLQSNLPALAKLPIFFDWQSATLDMVKARGRQMVKTEGVQALVVDYLQLLRLAGVKDARSQTRANEVSEISRGLKEMAMDLGVPVIALSQISNEGLKSGKASGVHLKESGAILADADIVIFIDADPIEEGEPPPMLQPVQFRIAKQRRGTTGSCNMIFRRADVTFHAPRSGMSLALRDERIDPVVATAGDDDDDAIPF